ncbi:unnamed protein product [Caenorhabditis brenneri]
MPGINQVQVYAKVAHFESEGIGSINVNLGPDDCVWNTVPMEFAASLESGESKGANLCSSAVCDFFRDYGTVAEPSTVEEAEDQVRAARIDSRRRGPVHSVLECQICCKKYDFEKPNMRPKFLTNCGHICCETCVIGVTVLDNVTCSFCRIVTPSTRCPVVYQLKRTGDEDSDTESEGE